MSCVHNHGYLLIYSVLHKTVKQSSIQHPTCQQGSAGWDIGGRVLTTPYTYCKGTYLIASEKVNESKKQKPNMFGE